MPSTTDACFASWMETLLYHPSATPFDAHTKMLLTAIKMLTDTAAATNLLQGTQANLAFLTTATVVKHQCLLYHHLEEFALPILNQQAEHYALVGFGDSVQPVTIDISVLFDVKNKHIPGLVYLKDLDTVDKANANPPTTGPNTVPRTEEALHSIILLPLWIIKVIEEAEASSFVKLFLLVCEKAHDQDSLVDAENDNKNAIPSTKHCKDVLHILQSLWY
eukprot:1139243-Ditylum_brightwellii.AAC.1